MGYNLIMETEGGPDRHFAVREGRNLIGRGLRCDVRISLPSVSTLHCEIMLENQRARLVNLDEIMGTLHNGQRVEEAELSVDDVLQIGPVRFRVDCTSTTQV
jgi:pSer/pThr/pTyr-binding forkhead associated (FHA) protein